MERENKNLSRRALTVTLVLWTGVSLWPALVVCGSGGLAIYGFFSRSQAVANAVADGGRFFAGPGGGVIGEIGTGIISVGIAFILHACLRHRKKGCKLVYIIYLFFGGMPALYLAALLAFILEGGNLGSFAFDGWIFVYSDIYAIVSSQSNGSAKVYSLYRILAIPLTIVCFVIYIIIRDKKQKSA